MIPTSQGDVQVVDFLLNIDSIVLKALDVFGLPSAKLLGWL